MGRTNLKMGSMNNYLYDKSKIMELVYIAQLIKSNMSKASKNRKNEKN